MFLLRAAAWEFRENVRCSFKEQLSVVVLEFSLNFSIVIIDLQKFVNMKMFTGDANWVTWYVTIR